MKPRNPPFLAAATVERRSVLQWLGGAAVMALGGETLSACLGQPPPRSTADSDAGSSDAAPDALGFAFEPGSEETILGADWYVTTVDPQDVGSILASWRLTIDGMVRSPQTLTFAELIGLPRSDQVTDLHCVEGWTVHDVPWNGIQLAYLLDRAGTDSSASHLTFHSVGGQYSESLPLTVAREPRTLLAYGVGGNTLPLTHGFPLRLVVPRLLGYKNAKFVERVEVTDHPVVGYWESYDYPYEADVPPERLRPGKY